MNSLDYMNIYSKKYRIPVIGGILIFLSVFTFFFYSIVMDISVDFPQDRFSTITDSSESVKEIVQIGIISRYPPEIIYKGYQPIMDYLNQNPEYTFVLKLSGSYQETVDQLANNEVAGAFLGTYVYIKAHEQYGVRCILKPLNENFEPVSSSAVIVKRGSNLHSISDLKGKRLALPSPESFSGKWLMAYELKNYGLEIDDLDTVTYFDHHQSVIYQVLKGRFDAGVVKERIAREYESKGINIIGSSVKIPGPPFVVPANDNKRITRVIKEAFLKIDAKDTHFRQMLKTWDSEYSMGFVEAKDADFDQIRRILRSGDLN
ncbi:MAG: PhnD/SsuA/transferrin family substrate-binding protein [Ignavibacteriales bacterium]|nr:PhnD/SsuA/transferrin family substrate-binding protein [Ignavibacteriales bacterium]